MSEIDRDHWVALLRGVNVGGHNKLPMKPLCAALKDAGFGDPTYYIQSGNLVFQSALRDVDEVRTELAHVIENSFALTPEILILRPSALRASLENCPFATDVDPKTLHFMYLSITPEAPDLPRIEALRAEDQSFAIVGQTAYLLAPSGIGRSKLMAQAERLIGVPATARNMRTVLAILALCDLPQTTAKE